MKMKFYCLSLLAVGLLFSCTPQPTQKPSEIEAAKSELAALLKEEGATFTPKTEVYEDENALVAILKAKNETDTLQASAEKLYDGLLLGAIRVKNKKDNQTATYTSTLVVRDSKAALRLTNVATKEARTIDLALGDDIIPPPPPPPPPPCDIDCCLDNFESYLCVFQNLANKFCKTYYPAVICCDPSQNLCISVHYIVRPTKLRCWIIADISTILENAGVSTLPRLVIPQPKPQ